MLSDEAHDFARGGEVEAWATPPAQGAGGSAEGFIQRKRNAVARGVQMGTALTDTGLQAQEFCGEAENWPTPRVSDVTGGPRTLNEDGARVSGSQTFGANLSDSALAFGTGGSLWPVTENEPGRVAKLRAIGNAVVPLWCVMGPFARIIELETQAEEGVA